MKTRFFLFLTCIHLCLTGTIQAQSFCGTEDSIDPAIEKEYLAYKNSLKAEVNFSRGEIQIPVQIHMIRPSDGISDFDTTYTDSILYRLNTGFSETPFVYYQCGEVDYINDDDYATFCYPASLCGDVDYDAFFAFHNADDAINIYLTTGFFGINASAFGYFPWSDNHAYVLSWRNLGSHVHEMGHVMGLLHTHTSGELVDGSNCLTAGDLCCDTPAEPSLAGGNVNIECEYVGNATDANGDLYQPNVGNHMSYAPKACRTFFTQDQAGRMVYFYNRYFKHFLCDPDFEYTDVSFTGITTSPYPAVENEPYSILIDTKNGGNTPARSFHVYAKIHNIDLGREYVTSLLPTNPRIVSFKHAEEFPHEPGRYLVCVSTSGDSLELYTYNNTYCQEILIRQEEGIPDLNISNLSLTIPTGEQNALNPVRFDIENLGSIVAEEVSGNIYINDVLTDSFNLIDIPSGDKRKLELDVFFGSDQFQEICIEMNPAFTEERLDNNRACLNYTTQKQILSDLAVDSMYILPNDSILSPNTLYTVHYRYVNHGPTAAWGNSSLLTLNGVSVDSIMYPLNWGEGVDNYKNDAYEYVTLPDATEVEFCITMKTYKDTLQSNNQLCITRPVEVLLSTSEFTPQDDILIYPNPFTNELNIKSAGYFETVTIHNILGNQVSHIDFISTKEASLPVAHLPAGIYHVVIRSENTQNSKTTFKVE